MCLGLLGAQLATLPAALAWMLIRGSRLWFRGGRSTDAFSASALILATLTLFYLIPSFRSPRLTLKYIRQYFYCLCYSGIF